MLARRPSEGCSGRPARLAARMAYTRRALRDRLAKGIAEARAPAAAAGRRIRDEEGQDGAGHCEVVQRREGLRLHRGRGWPGRVRALQRDHGERLPQPRGRAEGRVRHYGAARLGPISANSVCTTFLLVTMVRTWRRACRSPRLAKVIRRSATGRSLRALAPVVVILPCSNSAVARFARMCRWWAGLPPGRRPLAGAGSGEFSSVRYLGGRATRQHCPVST